MNGIDLIMTLAAIAFVSGLIRSFFLQERPDQNKEKKSEDLKDITKATLKEQKPRKETPQKPRVPTWEPTWEEIKQYVPEDLKLEYLQLPPQGQVIVRIFPSAPEGMFGRKINPWFSVQQMHYMLGRTVPCNKVLDESGCFKGSCPICKAHRNLRTEGLRRNDSEYHHRLLTTAARQIKPLKRYYVNVAEWDEESQSYSEPKVLSMGRVLFEKIMKQRDVLRSHNEDPLDVYEGRNFKIVKRLRGPYPFYDDSHFEFPSKPLCSKTPTIQLQKKMAKLHDLFRLHTYLTEDELSDLVVEWEKKILDDSSTGFFKRDNAGLRKGEINLVMTRENRQLEERAQMEKIDGTKVDLFEFHKRLWAHYKQNADAWVKNNLVFNPYTGAKTTPDEGLMQKIESHISNWYTRHDCDKIQFGETLSDWRRNFISFITDHKHNPPVRWDDIPAVKEAIDLQVRMDLARAGQRESIRKASPCYANTAKYQRYQKLTALKAGVDEDFIKELTKI